MPIGVNQGGSKYCVDITFVIDATGSMYNLIDQVKAMAKDFGVRVMETLSAKGKEVETLRAKVITYRDFGVDTDALVSSEFYTLPAESSAFSAYVDTIHHEGGGDEPENGLEALAAAMNDPDWTKEGSKRRHIIVLFTDASAKKLEESNGCEHAQYPQDLPANLAGLQEWWECGTPSRALEVRARRLIMFTPNAEPWNMIQGWNMVFAGPPVEPGKGCEEVTMDAILNHIEKSMAAGSNAQ